MIGNRIKFKKYSFRTLGSTHQLHDTQEEGLVVDAWTDVSGTVSGKTEVFLGFGEGKVSGSTKSKRMYKVECGKTFKYYQDIEANMITEITEFAKLVVIDEKIVQTK